MLFFPDECLGCRRRGPSLCVRCGVGLPPPRSLPPPGGIGRLVCLTSYDGLGRAAVTALKYRNRRSAVPVLASLIAAAVANPAPAAYSCVTWVPSSGRGGRRRGYDPARLLARGVARRLGLPCRRLLRRTGGTAQTGRSLSGRLQGPELRPVRTIDGAPVLVVDDVCTTGASLVAASAALRRAGAGRVDAATVARTPLSTRPSGR